LYFKYFSIKHCRVTLFLGKIIIKTFEGFVLAKRDFPEKVHTTIYLITT